MAFANASCCPQLGSHQAARIEGLSLVESAFCHVQLQGFCLTKKDGPDVMREMKCQTSLWRYVQ